MRLECPKCKKIYNVPDERLPQGKKFSLTCVACKGSIEVDLRNPPTANTSQTTPVTNSKPTGDALKKEIMKSVTDLPSMPQTVHKVREILSNADSSFEELAQVLETDQAIATRVLKMANSPFYGLRGKVSSIQHASVVLGQKTLGELITMVGTSELLDGMLHGYKLDAGDLWIHSLAVAHGSRLIAHKKNPALADDAFASGLIHDSGKLILDKYIFERQDAFGKYMANGKNNFLAAEQEILGFDHAEIASEVCKTWQVPEKLAFAIRFHHDPSSSQEDELVYSVHVADALAMMTGLGTGMDGMSYQMDEKATELLGLQGEDIVQIMGEMSDFIDTIST
ncbi:HDOD domain-containing protein [Thermodesulfobacteriota bacterium]